MDVTVNVASVTLYTAVRVQARFSLPLRIIVHSTLKLGFRYNYKLLRTVIIKKQQSIIINNNINTTRILGCKRIQHETNNLKKRQ